jgi:hypothetical protein
MKYRNDEEHDGGAMVIQQSECSMKMLGEEEGEEETKTESSTSKGPGTGSLLVKCPQVINSCESTATGY